MTRGTVGLQASASINCANPLRQKQSEANFNTSGTQNFTIPYDSTLRIQDDVSLRGEVLIERTDGLFPYDSHIPVVRSCINGMPFRMSERQEIAELYYMTRVLGLSKTTVSYDNNIASENPVCFISALTTTTNTGLEFIHRGDVIVTIFPDKDRTQPQIGIQYGSNLSKERRVMELRPLHLNTLDNIQLDLLAIIQSRQMRRIVHTIAMQCAKMVLNTQQYLSSGAETSRDLRYNGPIDKIHFNNNIMLDDELFDKHYEGLANVIAYDMINDMIAKVKNNDEEGKKKILKELLVPMHNMGIQLLSSLSSKIIGTAESNASPGEEYDIFVDPDSKHLLASILLSQLHGKKGDDKPDGKPKLDENKLAEILRPQKPDEEYVEFIKGIYEGGGRSSPKPTKEQQEELARKKKVLEEKIEALKKREEAEYQEQLNRNRQESAKKKTKADNEFQKQQEELAQRKKVLEEKNEAPKREEAEHQEQSNRIRQESAKKKTKADNEFQKQQEDKPQPQSNVAFGKNPRKIQGELDEKRKERQQREKDNEEELTRKRIEEEEEARAFEESKQQQETNRRKSIKKPQEPIKQQEDMESALKLQTLEFEKIEQRRLLNRQREETQRQIEEKELIKSEQARLNKEALGSKKPRTSEIRVESAATPIMASGGRRFDDEEEEGEEEEEVFPIMASGGRRFDDEEGEEEEYSPTPPRRTTSIRTTGGKFQSQTEMRKEEEPLRKPIFQTPAAKSVKSVSTRSQQSGTSTTKPVAILKPVLGSTPSQQFGTSTTKPVSSLKQVPGSTPSQQVATSGVKTVRSLTPSQQVATSAVKSASKRRGVRSVAEETQQQTEPQFVDVLEDTNVSIMMMDEDDADAVVPPFDTHIKFDYATYNKRPESGIMSIKESQGVIRTAYSLIMTNKPMQLVVMDVNEQITNLDVPWIKIDDRRILYDAKEIFTHLWFFTITIQDGYSSTIPKSYGKDKIQLFTAFSQSMNHLATTIVSQMTRLFKMYKGETSGADTETFQTAYTDACRQVTILKDATNVVQFLNTPSYKKSQLIFFIASALNCPPKYFPTFQHLIITEKVLLIPDMDDGYTGAVYLKMVQQVNEDTFKPIHAMIKTTGCYMEDLLKDITKIYGRDMNITESSFKCKGLSSESSKTVSNIIFCVFMYPIEAREELISITVGLLRKKRNPNLNIHATHNRWLSISSLMHISVLKRIEMLVGLIPELRDRASGPAAVNQISRRLNLLKYDLNDIKQMDEFLTYIDAAKREEKKSEYNRITKIKDSDVRMWKELIFREGAVDDGTEQEEEISQATTGKDPKGGPSSSSGKDPKGGPSSSSGKDPKGGPVQGKGVSFSSKKEPILASSAPVQSMSFSNERSTTSWGDPQSTEEENQGGGIPTFAHAPSSSRGGTRSLASSTPAHSMPFSSPSARDLFLQGRMSFSSEGIWDSRPTEEENQGGGIPTSAQGPRSSTESTDDIFRGTFSQGPRSSTSKSTEDIFRESLSPEDRMRYNESALNPGMIRADTGGMPLMFYGTPHGLSKVNLLHEVPDAFNISAGEEFGVTTAETTGRQRMGQVRFVEEDRSPEEIQHREEEVKMIANTSREQRRQIAMDIQDEEEELSSQQGGDVEEYIPPEALPNPKNPRKSSRSLLSKQRLALRDVPGVPGVDW